MLSTKKRCLAAALFVGIAPFAHAQYCAPTTCSAAFNAPSGNPVINPTPTMTIYSTCELDFTYSTFNVVEGHTYIWSSCGQDVMDVASTSLSLVLRNATTQALICESPDAATSCTLGKRIVWTATFTGMVDVAVHALSTCNPDLINPTWCYFVAVQDAGTDLHAMDGTTDVVCSGAFLDPGGIDYFTVGLVDITHTIEPDTPGTAVQVDFLTFLTDNFFGAPPTLDIYDGNSTAAPLIGTYSGTNSPGTVTSTAADGTLTFRYIGTSTFSGADWEAPISCVALPAPFPDSCNGDGGDQMGCTDCPCMNNAPQGTVGGCLNSAGTSSRLIGTGDPSLSLPFGATTDVRFQAEGMPPTAFGVLISGNAVAPGNMMNPCFGQDSGIQFSQFDGLRCSIQATQRHGGRSANAMGIINDSAGPSRVWGGEAQPNAGIGTAAGFVAGQTRYFQINHREDAMLGCMRGLNNSQSVEVTFAP